MFVAEIESIKFYLCIHDINIILSNMSVAHFRKHFLLFVVSVLNNHNFPDRNLVKKLRARFETQKLVGW